MRNLLIVAAIGFGIYSGYQKMTETAPRLSELHDEVIMYSLTTCGYCKKLAAEMDEEGVDYVELFLDEDRDVMTELSMKLQEAGFKPGGIGTPTLDVNGYMLANNPPLSDILYHMDLE